MKAFAAVSAALTLLASTANGQSVTQQSPLKCEVGPVSKRLGGSDWMVYSCDDQHSMVVISADGNPAMPFYFVLTLKAGTYELHGEGNGDKRASDAAGDELSHLTPAELSRLLAATKTSK